MENSEFWVKPKDIPLGLNLLRYTDGCPGDYQLRVYTLSGLNTNFARPCFAIADRGPSEGEDVAGVLEETLHRILDAGGTVGDVYRAMGLVRVEELDEDELAEHAYTDVDLGFVTAGELLTWETVPDDTARAENVLSESQIAAFARAVEDGLSLRQATEIAIVPAPPEPEDRPTLRDLLGTVYGDDIPGGDDNPALAEQAAAARAAAADESREGNPPLAEQREGAEAAARKLDEDR